MGDTEQVPIIEQEQPDPVEMQNHLDFLTQRMEAMATNSEVDDLTKRLDKFTAKPEFRKPKLPAKCPAKFKRGGDICFSTYAQNLNNYFRILRVNQDERSNCLLTYLEPQDFEAVIRIHPLTDLNAMEYNDLTEAIAAVLDQKMTQASALAKLMSFKQGDLPMAQYLKRIEFLALKAYSEAKHKESREIALMSAIQANCKSKTLSFQIHQFIADAGTSVEYTDVAKKCLELDLVLNQGVQSEEEDEFNNTANQMNIFNIKGETENKTEFQKPKCWICESTDHFKAECPKNKDAAIKSSEENIQKYPNKFGDNGIKTFKNQYNNSRSNQNMQNSPQDWNQNNQIQFRPNFRAGFQFRPRNFNNQWQNNFNRNRGYNTSNFRQNYRPNRPYNGPNPRFQQNYRRPVNIIQNSPRRVNFNPSNRGNYKDRGGPNRNFVRRPVNLIVGKKEHKNTTNDSKNEEPTASQDSGETLNWEWGY